MIELSSELPAELLRRIELAHAQLHKVALQRRSPNGTRIRLRNCSATYPTSPPAEPSEHIAEAITRWALADAEETDPDTGVARGPGRYMVCLQLRDGTTKWASLAVDPDSRAGLRVNDDGTADEDLGRASDLREAISKAADVSIKCLQAIAKTSENFVSLGSIVGDLLRANVDILARNGDHEFRMAELLQKAQAEAEEREYRSQRNAQLTNMAVELGKPAAHAWAEKTFRQKPNPPKPEKTMNLSNRLTKIKDSSHDWPGFEAALWNAGIETRTLFGANDESFTQYLRDIVDKVAATKLNMQKLALDHLGASASLQLYQLLRDAGAAI